MWRTSCLFLLLTGCAGCASTEIRVVDFLVDERFSTDQLEVISKAAKQWEDATGSEHTRLTFRPGVDLRHGGEFHAADLYVQDLQYARMFDMGIDEPGYNEIAAWMGDESFTGLGWEGHGVVLIGDAYVDEQGVLNRDGFTTIVLHELGHYYGLWGDVSPLMGSGGGRPCIDELTVDLYCAMHECVDQHGTCPEDNQ